MKFKNTAILSLFGLAVLLIASCKKESQNIFNMFNDVSVTYSNDNPLSVTDYKLVNDGDSVYINYQITSAKEDMYSVVVETATNRLSRATTPITNEANRRSISGVVKLKMQRDGKTSFRVYPLNQKGYFMGDGGKTIVVEVTASHTLVVNRRLYAPDTVAKAALSYYSVSKAKSFSYLNGLENSADIDFGLYRNLIIASNGAVSYDYFLYTLTATPNPLTVYDISSWTKRATLFGSTVTSNGANLFLTTLVSSDVIGTEAKKKTFNLTKTSTKLAAGHLIYFLTPTGKYGAILINSITKDLDGRPYIDISVKTQK